MGGLISKIKGKKKQYSSPAIASKRYPAFAAALPSLAGKTVLVTGCTSGRAWHISLATS
jgi:hypothetical protein